MSKSFYDYCIENDRNELLAQWHPSKNGTLTPSEVPFGSHHKIWWQCNKGHEYESMVTNRIRGRGCPICTGKRVLAGVNDLATVSIQLAAQWHPTKNGDLTPAAVSVGSKRKVWWRCDKGHEWQAEIKSRKNDSDCPYCANKKIMVGENDLATTHPEIACQWNYEKNGDLTPQAVFGGSVKKVWWVCDKGHEFFAVVYSRTTNHNGCPVCAGKVVIPGENDLASKFPEIAAQWHPTKNGDVTPEKVTPFSNKKVWWVCELGHEYLATIPSRAKDNSGCPYCAGKKVLVGFNDLATKEPMLATQWHQELNGDLTPDMVTVGSHKKVWWQCSNGHVWQANIYSRARGKKCGCPVCAGVTNAKRLKRYREMEAEAKLRNRDRYKD